jgi:hypothetical protein
MSKVMMASRMHNSERQTAAPQRFYFPQKGVTRLTNEAGSS